MAARTLNRLSATEVKAASKPGKLADGGGLYLQVGKAKDGAAPPKSWVFLFQWHGRTREMGLGSLVNVTLKAARDLRDGQAALLAKGLNPIEERDAAMAKALAAAGKVKPPTLKEAGALFQAAGKGPESPRGAVNFTRSINVHSGRMANMLVCDIRVEHVMAELMRPTDTGEVDGRGNPIKLPLWLAKVETAIRLRGRVEAVLNWAKAHEHIADPWSNPAAWERLQHLLKSHKDYEPTPRAALDVDQAALAVGALRALRHRNSHPGNETEFESNCTLAAEFVILTVARNTEGRAADWSELNRETRVWTCPAARMKMKVEHRVPLSDAAVAVLDRAAGGEEWPTSGLVFPSQWKPGQAVSETSVLRVIREATAEALGPDVVVTAHGWRSTFTAWAKEIGGHDFHTREACLAHLIGTKTSRAYDRTDALEIRRPIMEAWATFLATEWKANVVPILKAA